MCGNTTIISECSPQNPCRNIFIFIPFCKSRLFLSAIETEYLSLPFLACQLHSSSCNHCYKKPFIRVTPGEDKPCISLT